MQGNSKLGRVPQGHEVKERRTPKSEKNSNTEETEELRDSKDKLFQYT